MGLKKFTLYKVNVNLDEIRLFAMIKWDHLKIIEICNEVMI